MITFTQQREKSVGKATLSKVYVGNDFVCDILEDEVREIPGVPVAEWKIKGVTAIPHGRYRLTLETSNRFGPNTLTVNGVRGFDGIRIHGGNTSANTDGCPLPGTRNSINTVALSQVALTKFRAIAVPEIQAGNDVWLEILPALEEA